ncbi:hypothetical protein CSKR_101271 [Clonorchis sinensis]|uniref:PH domain-containing protein n=1 Tax=Clonorchis sinensis TaxID=79923 RepID=A0A8T1LVW4_CLOSI|nr:hypothetical protein CSKR_101271 [Clonorchis sinensis]
MSIKEGWLRKWSHTKNQWGNVYCKLLPSGWFQWYDDASSTSPKRSVDVRSVTAFLAFGDVLHRVPCKPASITPAEIPQAFGVPHEPRPETKVSFFVCSSPAEMNSWMNAIMSLIQGGGGYQPPGAPMGSMPPYSTPQGMSSMPGTIGFAGFADAPPPYSPQPQAPAYGSYQQQPGYSSAPAYNYPTGSYCQPQVPLAPAATYEGGGAYPRQPPPPPGQTSYYTPPSAGQQFVGSNGQPYEVVYVGGKPKKKKLLKNAAVGLASGLAGGYLASKVFGGGGWCRPWGGGWGGGWGMGRWGSWSSFSSLSWSD